VTRHYYLEGYPDGTRHPRRYDLKTLPAVVGRQAGCEVQLYVDRISRQHARFELADNQLTLVDLGSTNGTFVNRQRIEQPTALQAGYVLHFADHEFRLMEETATRPGQGTHKATIVGIQSLPDQFPLHAHEFFEMLRQKQVRGFKQVITTADGKPYGFELLGRGGRPDLEESPAALFNLAETLGAEVALSELFRQRCFEDASNAGLKLPLFFNTHPEESRNFDKLLSELQRLRKLYPDLRLVFEVHEGAITDLAAMAEVRRELSKLEIALAYDDFGAGQARLQELVEVPPDYLKFDIALVRNLEHAESPRYQMLSSLNTMISGMGIRTLAEGIETEQTASLCRDIGIEFFQGFLYGRPEPIVDPHPVPAQ
jgi:EAL domain-containing protein (putative c-di-GMP-specific phosphodiesterase class I)